MANKRFYAGDIVLSWQFGKLRPHLVWRTIGLTECELCPLSSQPQGQYKLIRTGQRPSFVAAVDNRGRSNLHMANTCDLGAVVWESSDSQWAALKAEVTRQLKTVR